MAAAWAAWVAWISESNRSALNNKKRPGNNAGPFTLGCVQPVRTTRRRNGSIWGQFKSVLEDDPGAQGLPQLSDLSRHHPARSAPPFLGAPETFRTCDLYPRWTCLLGMSFGSLSPAHLQRPTTLNCRGCIGARAVDHRTIAFSSFQKCRSSCPCRPWIPASAPRPYLAFLL